VIGLGNVNLGDETLFLDLKPYPRTDRGSLGSVRIPVSIRGTFATPEVSADQAGLAERLGAALGFSEPTLPAAVLPLLVAGLGEKNSCSKAFAAQPAAASGAGQGNSTQPRLPPKGR
jgi:AsmA family protein